MKKISYQKPTIEIVKLQHQSQILADSEGQASVKNYTWNDVPEE